MAKLSARGRTEVWTYELTKIRNDEYVEKERDLYRLMSDSSLLSEHKVWFKGSTYSPARQHSYGWKLVKKVSNPDVLINKLVSLGYVLKSGGK